ncbi:kelch-like protein 9 [Mizuhopecten yessoensis]|uniref:Kelch-like protein 9 n=2 Tax=Mizuhopecten yessoensis TaxID=6573 RepID=A0A210QDZ2_MIZYE|nr:kelch-like protein 9 [Mizuhopecten yessoensis]OWF46970.1 Kelch-like protein 9 [Mizuhopecten yessoensis]
MASGGNERSSISHHKQAGGYKQKLFEKRKHLKQHVGDQKQTKTVEHLSETVLNGFEVLWRQNFLCDLAVITREKTFHAHKLVLVSCSDHFYDHFVEKRDFTHGDELVNLADLDSAIFEAILECMYTGKINLTEGNVEEILRVATSLGFFLIQDACEEFFMDHLDLKNCLQMLDTAFKYSLNRLSDKALGLSAKNFRSVTKRQKFKDLPMEQVVALYKRDDLDADHELEVFNNMIDWIEDDKQARRPHASNLLATIRLPLLSPATIVDSVESVSFLMDIPDCQTLVKEALHYHCMPSRQSVLQSPRTTPRRTIKNLSLLTVGGAPRLKTEPVSGEVRRYNVEGKAWDSLTDLPEPRHHHAVAVLGGFLYVAGGEKIFTNTTPTDTVFRFDPRLHTWLQVASMNHKRQSFPMTSLNGMLYVLGGREDEFKALSSVEKYNPQLDVWEEVPSLSSARRCVSAAVLNGRLYTAGGTGGGSNICTLDVVECYSPTNNKWQSKKPIQEARYFAHLLPVKGSLYLFGGASVGNMGKISCVESIEKYTPTSDTWVTLTSMKNPRSEFGCACLGSKIYVVGGHNWSTKERLSSVDSFDVDSQIWSDANTVPILAPLTGIACCALTLFDDMPLEPKKKTEDVKRDKGKE